MPRICIYIFVLLCENDILFVANFSYFFFCVRFPTIRNTHVKIVPASSSAINFELIFRLISIYLDYNYKSPDKLCEANNT